MTTRKNNKKKLRPIFTAEQEETTFLAGGLGQMGFSTQEIADECNLSLGQVTYRLKVLDISRSDYRNGKSAFAREMKYAMLSRAIEITEQAGDRVR